MRNTSVLFYFSYIIYLIINKLSRKYENMRNEFDKFGSSSNLDAFTYHLPLRGLLLPEGGEWRILSIIKLLFS